MANNYNTMPIQLTATMASGWKVLQSLNTASLPSNAQQLSGAVLAQPGIRITKIIWTGRTASQSNSFVIQDPNLSTNVLIQGQSVDGANPADLEYDFSDHFPTWRDFKVTTLSSGTLLIYFRI